MGTMEINEQKLIEAGGKLWEKENMKRIYLNDDALVKYFGFELKEKPKYRKEFRSIKKIKVWYCCKDKVMKSDEGRIRVLFSRNGIKCREK